MLKLLSLIFVMFYYSTTMSFSSTNLFYIDKIVSNQTYKDTDVLNSIRKHHSKIQIISPQIFSVNKFGTIWGSIDPQLIKVSHKYNIKIMPLVINNNFDQQEFDLFLKSDKSQKHAIQQLIAICKKFNFYGIQLDMENIAFTDRDKFTDFVTKLSKKLHQSGFKVSVAIVPSLIPSLPQTEYEAWLHDNWSGAYDIKSLGKITDFITIMTYDRHTTLTTPGPIAPLHWVENILSNVLKVVSPEHVSLGVPLYSGLWETKPRNSSFQSVESQISYKEVINFEKRYKVEPKWNSTMATNYIIYSNPANSLNSYLFITDKRSFLQLIQLVTRYHLMGFSAWQMGLEDHKIWDVL